MAEQGRFARLRAWVRGPERPPSPPPEWVFRRSVAALALALVFALVLTPVAPLALVAWPVLGVQVYEDRRINGLGRAWPSVVATLGPLGFPFYVRARRRLRAALDKAAPPANRADGSPVGPEAERPADWYADPLGRTRVRYWNGTNWTSFAAR